MPGRDIVQTEPWLLNYEPQELPFVDEERKPFERSLFTLREGDAKNVDLLSVSSIGEVTRLRCEDSSISHVGWYSL